MDSGLIFTLGAAFGLLGGVGFVLLLVCSDDYATAYFSERWHRLGVPRSNTAEAQGTANVVKSSEQIDQVEQPRPACGSVGRGISLLLVAVLLDGCASSAGGVRVSSAPVRVEALPACGFEAPYLPDPCRLEIAPGEWLRISNPAPQETKRHGWLWWLLLSLVTL